jgi:hypothetical protein
LLVSRERGAKKKSFSSAATVQEGFFSTERGEERRPFSEVRHTKRRELSAREKKRKKGGVVAERKSLVLGVGSIKQGSSRWLSFSLNNMK